MLTDLLTTEQVQEYKDAFSLFDQDGDGQLSFDELFHLLHALGQMYTEEELKNVLREMDVQVEQQMLITFREFLSLVTNMVGDFESVREAFDIVGSERLDDDTSCGTTVDRLSYSEFSEFMSTMGECQNFTVDDIEKMWREMNLSEEEGELTVEHFLKHVNSM